MALEMTMTRNHDYFRTLSSHILSDACIERFLERGDAVSFTHPHDTLHCACIWFLPIPGEFDAYAGYPGDRYC